MTHTHESFINKSIKNDRADLSSPKILIADIPLGIGSSLVNGLIDRGFVLNTSSTWEDTVDKNDLENPAVIVADSQNLGVSPEGLARLGRSLIITEDLRGRVESVATAKTLNAGADFFLQKPVSPDLLAAHIQALLRRERPTEMNPIIHGAYGVDLDVHMRKFTINRESVNLTGTEYKLLETLMFNAGKVMTSEELLVRVWGTDFFGDRTNLRVLISKLRKSLELTSPGSGSAIRTMIGIGYILLTPEQQGEAKSSWVGFRRK